MDEKIEFPIQERDYGAEILAIVRSNLSDEEIKTQLQEYHENDVASIFEELTSKEREQLHRILGSEIISELVPFLDDAGEYLSEIDAVEAADIIEKMDADEAAEALAQAITDLVQAPDRTFLIEQIERAEALNKLDYTTESWEDRDIDGKLAAAKDLVDSDDAEKINTAANALYSVLENLKTPNTEDLAEQLDIARTMSEKDWTASSWSNFMTAYANAQEMLEKVENKTERTQFNIDMAESDLRNAIASLDTLERDELEHLISIANLKLNGLFTVTSKDALREVLANAEDIFENARTQNEIDQAAADLQTAIDDLVALPDYEGLIEQIERAEELINDGKEIEYSIQSWNAMIEAYNAAKDVRDRLEENADIVNSSENVLSNAISTLEKPNCGRIERLLEEIEALDPADYTPSSWQALMDAVEEAKAVVAAVKNGTQRDQDEIDAAEHALRRVKGDLKGAIDYTNLKLRIAEARAVLGNGLNYTTSSLAVLNVALAAAEAAVDVCEDQTTVDELAESLAQAIANLIEDVNYDALENAIKNAYEKLNDGNTYSDSTLTDLDFAIGVAEDAKNATTQAEVDVAVEGLTNAINALVDITKLLESIAKVQTLNYLEYTETSWHDLLDARNVAIGLKNTRIQEAVDIATENLEKAITALVKMDYSGLNSAIENAGLIVNGINDYTSGSLAALDVAIDEARLSLTSRDQDEVDAAAEKLSKANALVENGGVLVLMNYVPLEEAIENAENLLNGTNNYTNDALAQLRAAISAAKSALESAREDKIQSIVDDAVDALADIIANLEEMDYTELNDAIREAEQFVANESENDYPVLEWNALQSALSSANGFVDSRDQLDVNDAADALNSALEEAKDSKLNRAQLNDAIRAVEEFIATENENDYSVLEWNAFIDALNDAKNTVSSREQDELDNATAALVNAKGALVKMNYEGLVNALNKAALLDSKNYTTNSWGALNAAYEAASLKQSSRNQNEVDTAAASLEAAINALVDVTELNSAINAAENVAYGNNDYTSKSLEALVLAIKEAKEPLVAGSREEVAAAVEKLDRANALVENGGVLVLMNYTEFNKAEEAYEELVSGDYTDHSWELIEKAYQAAVAAKNKKDQDILDATVETLWTMIESRIPKNLDDLKEAITEAKKVDKGLYSAASYDRLMGDVAEAQKLIDEDCKDNSKFIDAINSISDAVDALVEITDIIEAIDKANEAINDATKQYTSASLAILEGAITAADITKSKALTDAEVKKAVEDIEAAIESLVDIAGLLDAIAKADAVKADTEKVYTDASINAFNVAYDAAIEARNATTQGAVDTAAADLEAAISALVDITKLLDAITDAEEQVQDADRKYTSASLEALQNAINDAKATLNADTQASADAAENALNTANGLVENGGVLVLMNYTEFNKAEEAYRDLVSSDYTTESWENIVNAYNKALGEKNAAVRDQLSLDDAVEELKVVIDARIPEQLDDLINAITEAIRYEGMSASFTTASWNKFVDALESAEGSRGSKKNSEIKDVKERLLAAIDGLVPANRDELVSKIEEALQYESQTDIWTADSIAALKAAREQADLVVNGKDNDKIIEAISAIDESIDALVGQSDLAELIKQITRAQQLKAENYTAASWAAFEAILNEAIYVRDNYTTQNEIEVATEKLEAAMEEGTGVLIKMNYAELENAIEDAEALLKEPNDYTADAIAKLQNAIDIAEAELARAHEDRVLSIVEDAVEALEKAVSELDKMNYSALENAIRDAQTIINGTNDFTADSLAALRAAVDKANEELAKARSEKKQSIVTSAAEALNNANALASEGGVLVLMDYTALDEAIARAEALVAQADKYSNVSVEALRNAIAVAKAELARARSEKKQSIVEDAAGELLAAISSLVDITELLDEITKADELKAENNIYTESSQSAFDIAYDAAVAAKNAATQEEVATAIRNLKAATDALVDVAELKATIEEADKVVVGDNDYTATSLDKLTQIIEEARKLLVEASKDEVTAAVANLNKANALVENGGVLVLMSYDALLEAIEKAEGINERRYTTISWNKLVAAVEAARAVVGSKDQAEVDVATDALNTAIEGLDLMRYGILEGTIERAEALNESDHSEKSWQVLVKALETAKAARGSRDQAVVDAAAKALGAAISALIPMDYNELEKYIYEAEGLDPSDYTLASWEALEQALRAAKEVLISRDQDNVDSAAQALREALDALVEMDYSKLTAAIEAANALNRELYTTDSWMALEAALKEAGKAYEYRVQADVDAATEALNDAIAELEAIPVIDLSELEDAIARAEALDQSSFTSETWAVLTDALAAAKEARNSTDQSVIDAATEALNDAIASLEKKPDPKPAVDYTELDKAIEEAEKLNKDDYSAETWAELEEKLAAAKEARNSTDQSVVNAATEALNDAIASLEEKPDPKPAVDYTELDKAIEEAEKLNKDDYTAESWAELEAKLAAAKEARNSTDQSVVDAAAEALNDAITALEEKADPTPTVDYTELDKAIQKAEKLNKDDYTAESWAELEAKLAAAKEARNSTDQSVVDAATEALNGAINALEAADATEPEPDSLLTTMIIVMATTMLIGAVAVAVVILRKKGILKF